MEKLIVKVDKNYRGDKYLFVFLPDGTKLPRQTELVISDKTESKVLTVKFQYGVVIDSQKVHFKRGKYYFNGNIIPGQKRSKKPVVVNPWPNDPDLFISKATYCIGQFSCTDFEYQTNE